MRYGIVTGGKRRAERQVIVIKIEGLNQNAAAFRGMGGNEEATIQKKIQSLKKELGGLERKDELSQEEAKKKKELEQQIAELEQRLQRIKGDETAEKAEKSGQEKSVFEQPAYIYEKS